MSSTDYALLDRWRAGDSAAGNELFQRHFDSIYRFFDNKITGDVDELVQATFLACVRSRDQFRKQSSFRTYLFTIARHELYAFLQKRRRDQNNLDFSQVSVMDLGTSPTARIARDQQRAVLLHALRTLPLEQQAMLELFYWEDMSSAELADVFGIAEPAARTRLVRARKALREAIEALSDKDLPQESVADLDAWARNMRERANTNND